MAYQSEIEKLEQRYRENPDQWFAALADSYRKAGDLDLALDVVRAGLEKRPNYVSGHIVLGRCLLQKHEDAAAMEAFERVLQIDHENVIALKALSEIGERGGRLDEAQRWLTRLLEVDAMNEEAEEALARVKQAIASAPPPQALVDRGPVAVEESPPGAPPEPPQRLEATVAESPEPEPPQATPPAERLDVERHQEVFDDAPGAPKVELEPIELDRMDGGGARGPVPADAATTRMESAPQATAGRDADAAGIEKMAFESPPPDQVPAAADGLEPMEFTVPVADEAGSSAGAPASGDEAPLEPALSWVAGGGESRQESTLDEVVESLPDLETAEAPPVAAGGRAPRRPSEDLPLIYPEDPAPPPRVSAPVTRDGEAPGLAEPEPVLTETMAELYAKQGLVSEARSIYQRLLEQRPGDPALASRLDELAVAAPTSRRTGAGRRLTAAETGGPSVRDYLGDVFGSGGAARAPEPVAAPPVPGPTPLESAFNEQPRRTPGEPTRRASDEVSLSAVFGEEPTPVRRPSTPVPARPKPEPGRQGFSFDEFFGSPSDPTSPPTTRKDAPPDDDDFKRWLKGLKS